MKNNSIISLKQEINVKLYLKDKETGMEDTRVYEDSTELTTLKEFICALKE